MLSDGEEIMPLAFFVLTQCRRVTDRQTDRQTDGHVAIAITRASIASRSGYGDVVIPKKMYLCSQRCVNTVRLRAILSHRNSLTATMLIPVDYTPKVSSLVSREGDEATMFTTKH